MCSVLGMEQWETTLDRVFELTTFLGRDAAESLAQMGLTESRAAVMWKVHRRGPCTQRALADALGVTPRTMTGLIDGLVSTGFVTREPHPSDRRAALITFTPHGQATARTLVDGKRQLARALFEDLPAELLDTFDAGLAHVVARLRALAAASAS